MAKEFQFRNYKADVKDGDGDEHSSTVRAAIVTKDTQGRDVATRGGAHTVSEGEVLVETDRPGVYDVLSGDAWKDTGYGKPATGRP